MFLGKDRLNYIYILERNNNPFYVGKTHNPQRREGEHKSTYGEDIKMYIIDCVKENNWKPIEQKWISIYKNWGVSIKNNNPGGGGPQKGIIRSEEFGKKISLSKKGKSRPKHEVIPATLAKQKTVYQYDTNNNLINTYPSAKNAAKKINVHPNTMYAHLSGQYKSCRTYLFTYKKLI